MALVRNILILTFEEIDTFNEKALIKKLFESKGYRMIAETKIEQTGIVKEWIMESPVQYGKFTDDESILPKSNVVRFNPAGGMEGAHK